MIFATRPSALARWQTGHVIRSLQSSSTDLTCEEVIITTKGDKVIDKPLPEIGGKGLFTFELEEALLSSRVDAAVHSLKDLPTEDSAGLIIGAVPQRADPRDVLICPAGHTIDELPGGAVIGTSSVRRQAQLLAFRPDLQTRSIRGNVDTRIRKVNDGQYDAIVLAAAGVTRLGLEEHITQYLPHDIMLPAPGQGALAVQCRLDDTQTITFLSTIHHQETALAVAAERAFLAALGGGCSLPVGALATMDGDTLHLQTIVASLDGKRVLRFDEFRPNTLTAEEAYAFGESLAREALLQGAGELIEAETNHQ